MVLMHWPPAPILVPPVRVDEVDLTDEGFLEFSSTAYRRAESLDDAPEWVGLRTVPEELYLRELVDLDLEDSRAIAEFTLRYGRLGVYDWADLPVERRRWPAELRAVDALLKRHLRPGETLVDRRFSHVEEVAVHARVVRDATRLWTAYREGRDLSGVVADWESILAPPTVADDLRHEVQRHKVSPEESLARAVGDFFPLLFDAALRPYHVRVEARSQAAQAIPFGFPQGNLFSALCLQLRNHMAENAKYRRCRNTTCGRLFVNKRSSRGAQPAAFKRRKGVEFCSDACMWAQNKRDRRNELKRSAQDRSGRNGSPSKGEGDDQEA